MDKSYIGKTATIIDDPLDKGFEAIILDYHEADNTCDIKVLLPGDRKRIRKIHGECLQVNMPETHKPDPEAVLAKNIAYLDTAMLDTMVKVRDEPKKPVKEALERQKLTTAEILREALDLYIQKHSIEDKPTKAWHP